MLYCVSIQDVRCILRCFIFSEGHVWYGMGVYFAVRSSYSTDPNYSPLDQNGFKRMYQVKVLTGLTTAVPRGYQDRYAPLVPGSDINR